MLCFWSYYDESVKAIFDATVNSGFMKRLVRPKDADFIPILEDILRLMG